MTPLGKFTLRLGLYGGVIAYLAADLFLFHGPLRRKIDRADPGSPESIAAAKANGVVARVFNHQITRSQLDRAISQRLWLEGKTIDSIPLPQRKIIRYAALDELIDHELLRVKAKAQANQFLVSEEQINQRLQRLSQRFESVAAMQAAMKSQGIPSESALRDRLAAHIQQEAYAEQKIRPLIQITDEEARAWFAENQKQLATPERIEARHIFLPTLNRPPDEAKAKLNAALADLISGKHDFATLAKNLSEDPTTKEIGGSLGWMTRKRLPADFSAPVFALAPKQPTLVRTRLGWHLVEVTNRKPPKSRTFDEAKPEVIAALESTKRHQAAADFRNALRRFEGHKIEVFHDMMAD